MSLYQCEHCGCCENTARGCYWSVKIEPELFDWTGIEDRRAKHLCSACGPARYRDGTMTGHGSWHGKFARTFLPMGMFKTNRVGNLEHVETGSEDFRAYALSAERGGE
jgi:hypothetical protein